MILNDYQCKTHGVFESAGPYCPFCGKKGHKVFMHAPAVGHDHRKFVDTQVEKLMGEFGLTDTPKQIDARETVTDVRRIRSNDQTPMPTASTQVSIDLNAMQSGLALASEPATAAFGALQGGGSLMPISSNAARYRGQGSRKPPISVAITDKR